jgi:thiamine-phosphate pyrophosphorylase
MLVTDRHRAGRRPLLESIALAVEAGVSAVQLREKDLSDRDFYELAVQANRIIRGRCALLLNSRLDAALIIGAQGVHLPEDGLPVEAARRLVPEGFLIGKSVHDLAGAIDAQQAGCDYVQLGTIFVTDSKPGLRPAGLGMVQATAASLAIPCIPVGGIDASNAGRVIQAGAEGVAVVSAILQAEEPGAVVREIQAAMAAAIAPATGTQR